MQLSRTWKNICTSGPFQKNVWEEDGFDIIKLEFMEIGKKLPVKEGRDSG